MIRRGSEFGVQGTGFAFRFGAGLAVPRSVFVVPGSRLLMLD
jgi:hypothetical protein